MTTELAYMFMLGCSITLMLAQLSVKDKKLEHIFFAVFCGSLSMVAVKYLTADAFGYYQYIVGLGTCGTCNVIWLIARATFRGENAIRPIHLVVAGIVSLLVMLNQLSHFSNGIGALPADTFATIKAALSEITQMLSSTILLLTFWEIVRKDTDSPFTQWQQRIYAALFLSPVLLCSVGINAFVAAESRAALFPYFVAFSAIQIMLATQAMLVVKSRRMRAAKQEFQQVVAPQSSIEQAPSEEELATAKAITELMQQERYYLRHSLKIIDIANQLAVSEYKVSRAVRYQLGAKNFNSLVNQYRVEHAKQLLSAMESAHWPIIVVGLESGFSTVSSFNRAFKSLEGCSPLNYREMHTSLEGQIQRT
ncbi:helix-turn-helix domain-containing protein [Alteromonas facilis]|uniref:helix-turn-helix domain-containing protein n=1 Tax=Alteromonas facilis TaxID=2048004 RepID=UPI000C28E57A|nr:AraC family transcriptional regulator [Alteromonas facilis]